MSSWGRICILVTLLIAWTAGVSLAISHLSPIDDLVRTAPIESTEKTLKELDRLTVQSEFASDLHQRSRDLLDQYGNAAQPLIPKLAPPDESHFFFFRKKAAGITMESLVNTVFNIRENPRINFNVGNNFGNYAKQLFGVELRLNYAPAEPHQLEAVSWFVWQPTIELVQRTSKEQPDNFDSERSISISSVSGPEERSLITVAVNDRRMSLGFSKAKGEPLIRVSNSPEDVEALLTQQFSSTENTSTTRLFEDSFYSDEAASRLAEDIALAIQNHLARLEKTTATYLDASVSIEKRRSELESRLRSSPELFAVSVFRASLITIVIVSVGFVLLRAFAAELTQARRLASSNLARQITDQFPADKLEALPEIIRAISGDGPSKSIVADGTPPDAITTAEKLGDAVSKFASAVKKTA